uniref:SXP/RAL-2 family protein Ani s 5-like cation-binding domain-containing protein n=1 Tax=Ascaris lumbricoides TaxID=6252 RepID=A0A9J2PTJ0_ASCLU
MFALIAIALLISNILAAPHVPQDARKVLLREPSPELLSDIEPTFLKEASEEAREEFEKIVNDESLTIGEVRSKMNEWASKQGGDVQRDFEKAQKEFKEMEEAFDKAVSESTLSTAAKNVFQKMKVLSSDENQTEEQQEQNISDYLDSLPEDTRNEVNNFFINLNTDVVENMEKEAQ